MLHKFFQKVASHLGAWRLGAARVYDTRVTASRTWKKLVPLILVVGIFVGSNLIAAKTASPQTPAPKPSPTARPQTAKMPQPTIIPGRMIVVVKMGCEKAVTTAKSLGNQSISSVQVLGKLKQSKKTILLVNTTGETNLDVYNAIAQVKTMPDVLYAEPDYQVRAQVIPNDPLFPQLYGMTKIDAPDAWNITVGDPAVIVGVIDTGIDYTHPDLAANVWTNPGEIPNNGIDDDGNGFIDDIHGWDFVNNDNDPFDDNGHGTHVSGTIAAVGNNGIGVVGVTWRTRVAALKFLDFTGNGSDSDAIRAFMYAITEGFPITSNSWGGGGFNQALQDTIAESGLAVCAAGNFSSNNDVFPFYPASYPLDNIISVAATDSNDQLASFSNFGVQSVDLAAPGVDILSTFPNNSYQLLSGTSMATPHVSGVAALLLAEYPILLTADLKAKILDNTDKLPQLAGFVLTGGRLNAFQAVAQHAPGKIEAEQYSASSGVTIEPTSDVGGGFDVTNIDTGDFMDYEVNVAATGSYIVDFRVASAVGSGRIELRNSSGTVLATVNVPNTGGPQSWQTVRVFSVNLTKGLQTLRVFAASGGFNLNWFTFILNSAPGRVEAENFFAQSGVTVEPTSDVGGGFDVTNIDTGDFMDYTINVLTSGRYLIQWRVASNVATGQIQLRSSSGTVLSSVDVPNTGGLQSWQTVNSIARLTAGTQTLRVFAASGGFNLNWFDFELLFLAIPGKVEAEDFAVASGVTVIPANDLGDGLALSFNNSGDFADYQVNVSAAGRYLVQYRIASGASTGQIQLKDSAGNVLAVTNVPNTGGPQNWQLAVATVTLPAGQQVIRVFASGAPFNLNWINFLPEFTDIPGKIEAENYSAQSGTRTEITTDTGNLFNVTSIDPGDFLEYKVNNLAPGAYDVQFRVANPGVAGKLDFKVDNSLVLATVNVPNTGGAQSWRTVTITTSIIAGQQTLRVQGNTGSLKLNWINFIEKPVLRVTQIAAGTFVSLAVAEDGTLWGWGNNIFGLLGDGTAVVRNVPVQVVNLSGVKQAATGSSHSLALKTDGTVWAWGGNQFGELGDGTLMDHLAPAPVINLSGVTAIASGAIHSLALKSDGTVWAWGANFDGELGNGTNDNSSVPVQVLNLTGVKAIAAGGAFSLALKTDGTVWAWGGNFDGELGDGTNDSKNVPVQVLNLSNVTAISAGFFHSLAVRNDGTVWAWGANFNGQLGDGTFNSSNVPVQVLNLNNVTFVSGGGQHSLAIRNDGIVFAWGSNFNGELGDGTLSNQIAPVQVQNLTDATQVAAGDGWSLAIKDPGIVLGWGGNDGGQVGDGNFNSPVLTPVRTLPLFPETWITIDDQSPLITYSGDWTNNGITHSSSTTCSMLTFSYTGTRLRIFGNKTPDSGLAEVFIDGVSVGHADFFNFAEIDSTFIFESPDVPYGAHTVKVIVSGFSQAGNNGKLVTIDFFQYLSFTKIDDTDTKKIIYSAGWTAETGKPGYLGTDHISSTTGSLASFTFLGTKVRYYGLKGPDFGFVEIYLDDVLRATIDCYSATRQYNVLLYQSEDIPRGVHILRVRVTGTKSPSSTGRKVGVDAFAYIK